MEIIRLWKFQENSNQKIIVLLDDEQLENQNLLRNIDNFIQYENFMLYLDEIKKIQNDAEKEIKKRFQNIRFFAFLIQDHQIEKYSSFQSFLKIQDYFIDKDIQDIIKNQQNKDIHQKQLKNNNYEQYEQFLSLQNIILKEVNDKMSVQQTRLQKGVQKLEESKIQIENMKKIIIKQKKDLQILNTQIDKNIDKITVASHQVQIKKDLAEKEKKILNQQNSQLQEKQEIIERELAKVKPMVMAAKQDVKKIDKKNLDELRAYRFPPDSIIDILTAMMKLLNVKDTSWSNMKKFLGQRSVIDQIVEINPKKVDRGVYKDVQNFINLKSNSFQLKNVTRISKAAAPIAQFVKAILFYIQASQDIIPLEKNLNELKTQYMKTQNQYEELMRNVEDLEDQQKKCQDQLQNNTLEQQRIKKELEIKEKMVDKAQSLLQGLNKNMIKWKQDYENIKEYESLKEQQSHQLAFIIMNDLKLQDKLIQQKLDDKQMNQFLSYLNINNIFDLKKYSIQKLNQVLIFDPNNNYQSEKLIFVHDKNLQLKIEMAVKFEQQISILIEKDIPYLIKNLLRVYKWNDNKFIHLQMWTQIKDYKLRLITKECISNYDLNIPIISFNNHEENIKDQFMEILLKQFDNKLLQQQQKNKQELKQTQIDLNKIEDQLLEELEKGEIDFQQEDGLISILNKLKDKNQSIIQKQEQIRQDQFDIDQSMERYKRIINILQSLLNFILSLRNINPFYSFQQNEFFDLIKKSISLLKEFKLQNTQFILYSIIKHYLIQIKEDDRLLFLINVIFHFDLFDRPNQPFLNFENFDQYEKNENLFKVLFIDFIHLSTRRKNQQIILPQFIPKDKIYIVKMIQDKFQNVFDMIDRAKDKEKLKNFSVSLSIFEKLILSKIAFNDDFLQILNQYVYEKLDNKKVNELILMKNKIKYWQQQTNKSLLLIQKNENINLDIFDDFKVEYYQQNNQDLIQVVQCSKFSHQDLEEILRQKGRKIFISQYYDFSVNFLQEVFKINNEPSKDFQQQYFIYLNKLDQKSVQQQINKKLAFVNTIIHMRQQFGYFGYNENYEMDEDDIELQSIITNNIKSNFRDSSIKQYIMNFVYFGQIIDIQDRKIIQKYFDIYFDKDNMVEGVNRDQPEYFGLDNDIKKILNIQQYEILIKKMKQIYNQNQNYKQKEQNIFNLIKEAKKQEIYQINDYDQYQMIFDDQIEKMSKIKILIENICLSIQKYEKKEIQKSQILNYKSLITNKTPKEINFFKFYKFDQFLEKFISLAKNCNFQKDICKYSIMNWNKFFTFLIINQQMRKRRIKEDLIFICHEKKILYQEELFNLDIILHKTREEILINQNYHQQFLVKVKLKINKQIKSIFIMTQRKKQKLEISTPQKIQIVQNQIIFIFFNYNFKLWRNNEKIQYKWIRLVEKVINHQKKESKSKLLFHLYQNQRKRQIMQKPIFQQFQGFIIVKYHKVLQIVSIYPDINVTQFEFLKIMKQNIIQLKQNSIINCLTNYKKWIKNCPVWFIAKILLVLLLQILLQNIKQDFLVFYYHLLGQKCLKNLL